MLKISELFYFHIVNMEIQRFMQPYDSLSFIYCTAKVKMRFIGSMNNQFMIA